MSSELIAAVLGAVAGGAATELLHVVTTTIRNHRNGPRATADYLLQSEPEPAIASIDLFIQNRADHALRPKGVCLAKSYPDGYVHSWRAEDSPVIEPKHVTRVDITPVHLIREIETSGISGRIKLRIDFYDGSQCYAHLNHDRDLIEGFCGSWPPPIIDGPAGSGIHAARLRKATDLGIGGTHT